MINTSVVYHNETHESPEGAIVRSGKCIKHPDVAIETRLMGISLRNQACYRCELEWKAVTIPPLGARRCSAKSDNAVGVYLICGGAGSGKSTLFNYLTGLSRAATSSVVTVTSIADTHDDIIQPKQCVLPRFDNFMFCDSEGIGATAKSQEEALAKLFTTFELTTKRIIKGLSGTILCLEIN